MSNPNEPLPGFNDFLASIRAGVEQKHLKREALDNAELTTGQLRSLAATVAGRLMAAQSLSPEEQKGARTYLEKVFHTLDRIDDPANNPNNFPEGSNEAYTEQFRYRDNGLPVPALSFAGTDFKKENGLVDTGLVLLDAGHERRERDANTPGTMLSAEGLGAHWVTNQLTELYDFKVNHPEGDQPGYVPPLDPGEVNR